MPAPSRSTAGVRPLSSAQKTLATLEVMGRAERPMRLAEVAAQMGASRATTYQRLVTLVAAGWLEQSAEGSYRLTWRAARLGEAALRQAGIGERASHVMDELVTQVGETVCLAVINGVNAEIVQRSEPDVVVRVQRAVGTRLSLNNSAAGRVLTAFGPDEQRPVLVKKGGALASETVLRDVRRLGYAISTGRDQPGAQSVAVPVFGANAACVAALVVVAPTSRFNAARYIKPLARAAERLRAA